MRRRSIEAAVPRTFPLQEHRQSRQSTNRHTSPSPPLKITTIIHLDIVRITQLNASILYISYSKKPRSNPLRRIPVHRTSQPSHTRRNTPTPTPPSAPSPTPPYDLLLLLRRPPRQYIPPNTQHTTLHRIPRTRPGRPIRSR